MSTQTLSPRADAATASVPDVAALVRGRRGRACRRILVSAILLSAVVFVYVVTLMVGNTFYTPDQVIRVILGQTVPGASFTIGELRLPRASLGLLSGLAFGMAGVTFQTMLRNPLASPDIIGISSGASAFAVVAIIGFSLSDAAVSAFALFGALATAGAIYLLSRRGAFTGTRLVLIGIGVAAMLDSVTTWMLTRAANWDLQTAMQWLTGSLNNASWERLLPLAVTVAVVVPLMVAHTRGLAVLRLGDDSAAGLGVRVERTRLLLIVGAVVMLAVATAASGPIAFVAFMAGPIAARLIGPGGSLLVPAGLVGALLVMLSDLLGQFAFDNRYPVGVITGVLGAPYLIYLLIRTNRSGGSL
ncbi:iron complex transport system permease protein [Microbacterium proteolyticum]|uniref:Iron complex transport system permease protein n=1 Tax=Microbacterium proteolyticum TaxID=1572644 RepID=A0A7W5GEZ0_9MICO|nr:iron complex transport system permease protein [Microbacterium proteolyticum]